MMPPQGVYSKEQCDNGPIYESTNTDRSLTGCSTGASHRDLLNQVLAREKIASSSFIRPLKSENHSSVLQEEPLSVIVWLHLISEVQ